MGAIAESVRPFVLKMLPYDRSDAATVEALEAKSVPELLVIYLNWRTRLIPVQPRAVFISDAFKKNPVYQSAFPEIEKLLDDVRNGANLAPRLSRQIEIGFCLPKRGKSKPLSVSNRPDLDLLLNDWNIHHLHISSEVEPDGFVRRGNYIVFGIFTADKAFLIDICNHNQWSDQQVVAIAVRNWPNEELFLSLKGISPPRNGGFSDDDISQLRRAGISNWVLADGKIFISRSGGISTAGTSSAVSLKASRIMRILHEFDDNFSEHSERIRAELIAHGIPVTGKMRFEFHHFANSFGVVETTTNAAIVIGM